MRVMVIVKASRSSEAGEMPSTALLAAMADYNQQLIDAGILLLAEGLHPSSKGARVRFSGSDRVVIDGPFAQTEELVAGFWIWRVSSLQEAIDWVKKCPNPMTEDSDIEIRQIFEAEDFGDALSPEVREQEAAVRAQSLGLNKPTFRDSPALVIAGLNESYTSDTRSGIPEQWHRFLSRAASITNRQGSDFYGVCWNIATDGSFRYLTGVEVSAADQLADEFTPLKLDARRYVVFPHSGHVSALPQTMDMIWSQWISDCGLNVSKDAPCFERYTSAFNSQTGLGGMEIWIPLAMET